MSKRKKNRGKSASTSASSISGTATAPERQLLGVSLPTRDPGRKWRWLVFGVLTLGILAGMGLYAASEYKVWPFQERETVIKGKLLKNGSRFALREGDDGEKGGDPLMRALRKGQAKQKPQEKWKIEAWVPVSEQDKILDGFIILHEKNDPAASALLPELPAGDGPVSEAEYERRAANDFLRKKNVRIIDVWRGEPGPDGKPRPSAGRYTLVTRGSGATPSLRVRDSAGRVSPTSYSLRDPVVVVEVKGKTIQPLRTEINKRP